MNRKITLRAVAVRSHAAEADLDDGAAGIAADSASLASRPVSATAPNPAPASNSQSRRVRGVARWGTRDSRFRIPDSRSRTAESRGRDLGFAMFSDLIYIQELI